MPLESARDRLRRADEQERPICQETPSIAVSSAFIQRRQNRHVNRISSGGSLMPGQSIEVRSLLYSYRRQVTRRPALDGVDLAVPAGEFLAIMGPSGSGKSTLIRLIAGLQAPDRGSIRVGETEISAAAPDAAAVFRRRHIGLVFQFFDLIPDFTLRQNVALQLLMDGKRMPEIRDRVDALLDQLGLGDRMEHAIEELSGGELQRVAIARALVGDPAVVLADEPTANLEERASDEVIGLFAQACRGRGATTVVVTHNPAFQTVADRTLWMRDGRLYDSAVDAGA
jgi:putative ABC transport system ATP-binding protein